MLVQHVDQPVGQPPHEKQGRHEDKRLAIVRTGYLAHGPPSSARRQGAVEMGIPAVHHDPLARGMRRQGRQQERRRVPHLLHRGHAMAEGDVADDGFQLGLRIGERMDPPLVERRPDLGGHERVHADAVVEIGGRPFAGQGQDGSLGGGVPAGVPLPGERGLGTEVQDGPLAPFQLADAVVRHRVVMDEVPLKRHAERVHPVVEAHVVVAAGAVDQPVDAVEHRHDFLHGVRAGPFVGQLHLYEMHLRLKHPDLGPENVLQRAAAQNHGDRALSRQRDGNAAADAGSAPGHEKHLVLDPHADR